MIAEKKALGGYARAASLTSERRSEIASNAARTRWETPRRVQLKTMICLVLDRSGSMSGRVQDVVGGVNTFLENQKKMDEPASIAMVRFDTEYERFLPMGELKTCEPITRKDFQPRGSTALLDAVGKTITTLDEDWAREQPDRCILMIVTDGEENSSHEYTKERIKNMIQARQDSGKWAFIYLGANVDAFHEASSMGISGQNTAGFTNTQAGNAKMYAAASASIGRMRMTGQTVAHNLNRNIGEDDDPGVMGVGTPPPAPVMPQTKQEEWKPPQAGSSQSTWTPPAAA
jgi:uncharacterized protein YegL